MSENLAVAISKGNRQYREKHILYANQLSLKMVQSALSKSSKIGWGSMLGNQAVRDPSTLTHLGRAQLFNPLPHIHHVFVQISIRPSNNKLIYSLKY